MTPAYMVSVEASLLRGNEMLWYWAPVGAIRAMGALTRSNVVLMSGDEIAPIEPWKYFGKSEGIFLNNSDESFSLSDEIAPSDVISGNPVCTIPFLDGEIAMRSMMDATSTEKEGVARAFDMFGFKPGSLQHLRHRHAARGRRHRR